MAERTYIIYRTTNLINQMVYIGIHLNNKLDPFELDGYFGSGSHLKRAIKEFGKENFVRETLFVFDTKEEAQNKEKELVTLEFVAREDTYNCATGGGDWPVMSGRENPRYGKHHTEKTKQLIRENRQALSGSDHPQYEMPRLKETKEKISKRNKEFYASPEGKIVRQEMSKRAKERTFTEETRQKMSESHKGEKNFNRLSLVIVRQRYEDIRNILKICGWKTRLSKKWGVTTGTVTEYIDTYHPEFSNPPLYLQRIEDIENEPKTWGWKSRLSRKWEVSYNAAWEFINKHASDLVDK